MELINYRITLDVLKNGVQKVLQGFNTGDAYTRRIEISLVKGNELYTLTDNAIAVMYSKHETASEPSINACEIVGNKVIYNILPSDISTEGIVDMQLKVIEVTNDIEKVLVSPRFELNIWEGITDDSEAEQTPVFTALETALAEAKAFKDKTVVSVIVDEDYLFIVTFGDGSQYTSTVIQDAMKDIANVEAYVAEAKEASEIAVASATSASASEVNAETSAQNAEASKQYIIDHREELMGEPGVIYKDTEPTDPAERVGIWINPNAPFVPIPTGGGGGADIDDSVVATDKTWSSAKINAEIESAKDDIEPTVESVFDSHKSEFVTPTNLKTINGNSLIGSGNIVISGGGSIGTTNTLSDMAYTYEWTYPYMKNADGMVFIGYVRTNPTDHKNYIGVAKINNGIVETCDLIETNLADDHNACAVEFLNDKRVVCACPSGHGLDDKIHLFVSEKAFQINNFTHYEVADGQSGRTTSYSQLFAVGNNIYILYRSLDSSSEGGWKMTSANISDFAFSVPKWVITSSIYATFRPLNSEGLLLVSGMSHPSASTNLPINGAKFNVTNGNMYDLTDSLVANINDSGYVFSLTSYTGTKVILKSNATYRRRFFATRFCADGNIKTLVAEADNSDMTLWSLYYASRNASTSSKTKIADMGSTFYSKSWYLGGACFIDDNTIAMAYIGDTNKVEVYDISTTTPTLKKTIDSRTSMLAIRPLYADGKLAYQVGTYTDGSFYNHSLDYVITDYVNA